MTERQSLRELLDFAVAMRPKNMRTVDAMNAARFVLESREFKLEEDDDAPDKNPNIEALSRLLQKIESDNVWEEASWGERNMRRSHARAIYKMFDVTLRTPVTQLLEPGHTTDGFRWEKGE